MFVVFCQGGRGMGVLAMLAGNTSAPIRIHRHVLATQDYNPAL